MQAEGVIKFDLQFTRADPSVTDLNELKRWRSILWNLKLIGQDPGRYGGYGFGNVSQRIEPFHAARGNRAFLISGTQTGKLAVLDNQHFATVSAWDTTRNRVIASGPVKPSSESLTHAAIYDLDDALRVILHVHSPQIWNSAADKGIASTDPAVEYGTPAMAEEVRRLFSKTAARHAGLFAMGGHADGVVSFGADVEQAGQILLQAINTGGRNAGPQA